MGRDARQQGLRPRSSGSHHLSGHEQQPRSFFQRTGRVDYIREISIPVAPRQVARLCRSGRATGKFHLACDEANALRSSRRLCDSSSGPAELICDKTAFLLEPGTEDSHAENHFDCCRAHVRAWARTTGSVEPTVLTNNLGYETRGPKHAVILGKAGETVTSCALKSAPGGEALVSLPVQAVGPVKKWRDWYFWTAEFDSFEREGEYYLGLFDQRRFCPGRLLRAH